MCALLTLKRKCSDIMYASDQSRQPALWFSSCSQWEASALAVLLYFYMRNTGFL